MRYLRCAKNAEDLEQLVYLRVATKEWLLLGHLGKNASQRPNIDWGGVLPLTKQDLRSPVPQRNDFVSVSLQRQAKRASKPKVGYLQGL
jgi:hypothetical protein